MWKHKTILYESQYCDKGYYGSRGRWKIGFVTDEDDTSKFLRINFKSANSVHNGVHILKYEEPLRCSTCHKVVPF
jgi:hypothetical protein